MGFPDFNKAFDTDVHKEHGIGATGEKRASRELQMGHVRRAITELKAPAWSLKTSLI